MKEEIYKTTDLCLAAILKTRGFELVDWQRINENKIEFHFEKSPQLLKEISDYYKKDSELKIFYRNLKELKSLIYST